MNLAASSLGRAGPASAMPAPIRIAGGRALVEGAFTDVDVVLADGLVAAIGGETGEPMTLDARGLLVLPGIVDIHGDGFERLVHPRPGVGIDPHIALLEADRQFAANGITTACHAVTWSWEGGARGAGPALAILDAVAALKPHLSVDTLLHLRHETFNLDAEPVILGWIEQGRIDCLAFNDHMAGTIKQRHRPDKMAGMVARSGLTEAGFLALVERTHARADEVPASIARLAAAARGRGLPMLSHDDMSPEMRAWYRGLGCVVAEFPINEETARAAAAAGDPIVFGAPNVLRGGSHTGCPSAAEMAAAGLCSALASDYYYPALPLAPFRLAKEGRLSLARTWDLVSSGPAEALGLADRGRLVAGGRADVVLMEDRSPLPPRVVATLAGGRLVHAAGASLFGPGGA